MMDRTVVIVVGIRCRPEIEEKFNNWYDKVHIPNILKFPRLKKVVRYKILNETEQYPTYLTILEFQNRQAYEEYEKSDLLAAERKAIKEFWKDGGWEIEWRVRYELMRTWER